MIKQHPVMLKSQNHILMTNLVKIRKYITTLHCTVALMIWQHWFKSFTNYHAVFYFCLLMNVSMRKHCFVIKTMMRLKMDQTSSKISLQDEFNIHSHIQKEIDLGWVMCNVQQTMVHYECFGACPFPQFHKKSPS